MEPLVTVLICTNKISKSFFNSINSICVQDYQNLLLAIFFDGVQPSANDLRELMSICNHYSRHFEYIIENINIGLTAGLCLLQSHFPSDFYARLDCGDTWESTKLSQQIKLILLDNYSIVGTRSMYVQDDVPMGLGPLLPNDSNLIIHRIKSYKGLFDHSSILFSGIYKYNHLWYYSQDMMLYVDIANKGGTFGFVSEPLTNILYNPKGITVTNRPLQLYYEKEARKRLYNIYLQQSTPKHYTSLKKPATLFSFFYRQYIISMQKKIYALACVYLFFACVLDPRLTSYYIDRIKARFC